MMLKYFYYRKIYFPQSKINLVLRRLYYQKQFQPFGKLFSGKTGIEIGGPSKLFSEKILPIYQLAERIDGCNFSSQTVWEGNIESSDYEYFNGKKGKQIIAEGSSLDQIADGSYDFVLSCHNLEHIADPIKAVKEWSRLLKKGGALLMVLPDKRYTFDQKRPYTTFEHVLGDYKNQTPESDQTHLQEVLELHDLEMDPPLRNNFAAFKARCEDNINNRCLHHHVFSQELLREIFNFLNINTVQQYFVPPMHQIIIGIK